MIGKRVWTLIREADGSPEALGNDEKSVWEHYNEITAREDNTRDAEWRDLADTILIFVCLNPPYDT